MQSKVRLFGHAVHPMLVDFPIVCFVLLAVLDVAEGMGWLAAGKVPLFLVGIGGTITILAIITGTIDLAFLPNKTRAHKLAVWHFAGGILIWLWFGVSSGAHTGTTAASWAVYADIAGVLLIIGQSWLGGELMERHHIGIRSAAEGADPVVLERKKGKTA